MVVTDEVLKMFIKLLFFGIIYALPYVFPKLWILSWVGLIPLIYTVIEKCSHISKKRAYFWGVTFGLGYFGVMFHWFINFYPMEFAGVTKQIAALLVAVCWIGLSLVQALEFGFLTLIYRLIRPKKSNRLFCALTFAAFWVVFEWQQSLFWRGVPWARLSITQSEAPFVLQSASLFGNLFITGLIVAVNALLTVALMFARDRLRGVGIKAVLSSLKNKKTAIFALAALAIFVVNLTFGTIRTAVCDTESDTPIKAAVIQGNISSLDKWGATALESLELYLDITEECVNETSATLVVWPESVIPSAIGRYPSVMRRIASFAERMDITLFVGAFDDVYTDDGELMEYNAIYLFRPDGSISEDRYYKRRLVPFGEYTPMQTLVTTVLPVLDTFNIFNDPLDAGVGSQLFDTEYGKIGSLICFDSIYDTLATESVRDGAQLLTLSTNDSWFSDSAAVYQHNRHAMIRAIENGRYIVRAASTGVSSVFTPTGEMLTEIKPLTKGYSTVTVYALKHQTLYTYIGNVFAYLCVGYTAFLLSYVITLKIKRNIKKRAD